MTAPQPPPSTEWALLLTSLSNGASSLSFSTHPVVEALRCSNYLQALRTGAGAKVLASAAAATKVGPRPPGLDEEEALQHYCALRSRVQEFCIHAATLNQDDHNQQRLELLGTGVAALYLFMQANVTGPPPQHAPAAPAEVGDEGVTVEGMGKSPMARFDRWARQQLCVDGEDPIGKYHLPQFLLVARILLVEPCLDPLKAHRPSKLSPTLQAAMKDVTPEDVASQPLVTAAWWAARVVLLQQRLLTQRAPSLRAELLTLHALNLKRFSGTDMHVKHRLDAELWSQLAAAAHLEAAMMEHTYLNSKPAELLLDKAFDLLKIRLELTGVMGKRTQHQVDSKSQLVVVPRRELASGTTSPGPWEDSDSDEGEGEGARPPTTSVATGSAAHDESVPAAEAELKGLELEGVVDRSNILVRPDLETTPEGTAKLRSVEMALTLAQCITVKKSTASDDLQGWQMQPYVDVVTAQSGLRPMLRATCHLLTARFERSRERTRERAMLTMEKLVDGFLEECPPPAERMRYAAAVWFPPQLVLRKEWGECLIRLGIVGGALSMFEELELWDNLILCYRMLDKPAAAMEVVRDRLEVTPKDARLWCALGDLTKDESHYVTAWEVSNHRHSRAKRSLARSAAAREDFEACAGHWEAALATNSLDPDGWFAMGYALLKLGQSDRALAAFTRCAQLEPEHGQAWNNIAALCLRSQRWRAGFKAVQEALKHSREVWQSWDNLATVAARLGEWNTVIQATEQVFELTRHTQLDLNPLIVLLQYLETPVRDVSAGAAAPPDDEADTGRPESATAQDATTAMNCGFGWEPEDAGDLDEECEDADEVVDGIAQYAHTERSRAFLRSRVLDLMKKIAPTKAATPGFWGCYARLHMLEGGSHDLAIECLVKQCRGLQMTKWQNEDEPFQTFAQASLDLCSAYRVAASLYEPLGGSSKSAQHTGVKELSAARMHLQGIIKMSREKFGHTAVFGQLQQCLQEILNMGSA